MSAGDGSRPPRICECGCGLTFAPKHPTQRYASEGCRREADWARRSGRQRSDPSTEGHRLARLKTLTSVCPVCGSKLGHDSNLLYCGARATCDWSVIVRRAG